MSGRHKVCGLGDLEPPPAGIRMFAFFSNRLGCIGSIVVSILGTLLLLFLTGLLSR